MKHLSSVLLFGLLPLTLCAQPRSTNDFIAACRAALVEKSPEKLFALCYTVGMSDADKAQAKDMQQEVLLGGQIESLALAPLPKDYQSVYIVRGKKIEMTYAPAGLLEIKYKDSGNGLNEASAPYAIVQGRYYLVSSKSTDLHWSGPPDKSLGFMVVGKGQNRVCVQAKWNASGVEVEQGFGMPSTSFWGQHFERVTVTSTNADTDVTLKLLENGKEVFVSEPLKGKGTIEYKKKN